MTMRPLINTMQLRTLLVALALVAAPTTAAADNYELSIGSTARWMHRGSMDAVTADNSHNAFSVGVAIRLNRVTIPFFDLYVDAMVETGSIDGETFQRIDSETSMLHGMVGARAQRRLSKHFYGFGRAAIGTAKVSLTLRDTYSYTESMEDRGVAGTTYWGGGLDLIAIRKPRTQTSKKMITMGLRAEAGYTAFTSVSMRAVPASANSDDDIIRIPTKSIDIGDVNLSAWSFRVGLYGRF